MNHPPNWVKGDGRVFRPIRNGQPLPNWHIAYWGPKGDGKWGEIRESSHTPDEKKARRLLRARLSAIDSHKAGKAIFVGPKGERVTVRELLASLISDYETRRLPSLPQSKNAVRHLNAILGDLRAINVGRGDYNHYIAVRRSDGVSDTTIDRELEKLGRAYAMANEDGRISVKPRFPHLVKMHSNARQGFFESAEISAVIGKIGEQDIADFLWWFRWTGMRPKEIRSLTWVDLDRETWTLTLAHKESKTGVGRSFPLAGMWREIIERRVSRRRLDCKHIFHRDGRRMPNLQRRWRKACKDAGVEGKIIYDLRRTAVRDLIRAGVPFDVVKKISGHKTNSMVDRYNIINQADLVDASGKLDRYVAAQPGERFAPVVQMQTRKVNEAIAADCDRMVAFWDGKSTGTQHVTAKARKLGRPVEIRMPEPCPPSR